ncbi:MAG: transcription antitermination factor NusB [Armatimonadetes bacterium]|nr:transcription antitermination factor NusB [Armatimonadota bacterium]NIM23344.1 transcription antitermination factor NusB [Armatimonadota bacterium]NIM67208.1 transcription antitermination factor NusB [Armatimonadota bacterium]NIM75733.1 transcription antitermination factor NusB [Armatimonadota bacterium]NIN05397.1 transcription antitermination factor NusB [Armatimonadota bacterium]
MGKRRAGRELALKVLFQNDVAAIPYEEALEAASEATDCAEDTLAFARRLVLATLEHMKEIDLLLARYAKEWPLDRMANVDRSLLRLATCEIMYCPDIPNSVSVDEAVELAKKYSTADSGKFINGILGSLLRDVPSESPA